MVVNLSAQVLVNCFSEGTDGKRPCNAILLRNQTDVDGYRIDPLMSIRID